jgi:hypothetical protein
MLEHTAQRNARPAAARLAGLLSLGLMAAWTLACRAEEPPSRGGDAAPEFKLETELFDVRKTPEARSELLSRNGTAYQFIEGVTEEVIVIEPARRRVELLDLRRSIRTVLTAQRLDAAVARLHRRLTFDIDRQTQSALRRDRVAAEMDRDLADPRFIESYDPTAHRLRLSNPTVEVVALGEPETERERLDMVTNSLAATTKLAALRDPDGLPPFARLDTLRILSGVRRLRPTEITYLYRLGDRPTKVRWTYRLIPSLTAKEREVLSRIEARLETARMVEFADYDRPGDAPVGESP